MVAPILLDLTVAAETPRRTILDAKRASEVMRQSHLGISRYLRPMDSSSGFWRNRIAL